MEWIKNIGYCVAFCYGWICDYSGLASQHEVILILVTLMILDSITGYTKVAVLGNHPTSTRLSIGVISKVTLLILPFTIALLGKGLGINIVGLATGSIMTLLVSEAISVITNIYIIRTKKEVKEFDIVSVMLLRVRKVLLALAQKSE